MRDDTDAFWAELHERWSGTDREQERRAVRSVLTHLRRRLPGPELEHLEARLPEEVRRLWAEPALEARRVGQRPLEKFDFSRFLTVVRDEAGLSDVHEAEDAILAVFHALGRVMDHEEREHVVNMLPAGLKERWARELDVRPASQHETSGTPGSSPRWTTRRPGGGRTARRSRQSRGSKSWSE